MNDPLDSWLAELISLEDDRVKMTEKQFRIVQAAVEIFAEKGYAATSTSEIAQKAGVAEGTIFRHYKTKKDLLLSIVAPMMSKLVVPFVMRDFGKVFDLPYERYEDFLRAVLLNRMEFARKHLPALKVMLQEIPFHPDLKKHFIENVGARVMERFRSVIEHFQDRGAILPIPAESAVRLSVSVLFGYILTRFMLLPEREWDDEREAALCVDFIMHGLAPRVID
ncbi:TetR/AcrR family transcriptional regulator [Paenibacillus sp. MBLB4367]|uniref:TetR/AcrR family transcriptional regulator n=1 Tax=Paenibacillus sp. MBLB4367 TaxID=3384767 RepID=UPI0039082125